MQLITLHLNLDNIVAVVDCARSLRSSTTVPIFSTQILKRTTLRTCLFSRLSSVYAGAQQDRSGYPEQLHELKALVRGLQKDAVG